MNPAVRNPVIDDLCGTAILTVMLLHFGLTYGIWDKGPLVWLVGPTIAWSLLGWAITVSPCFSSFPGFSSAET